MPSPAAPGPADDIEDRDPGLARERTDLAWTRTSIAFAALGAAMMRTNALAGALVMVAGAAVWGLGQLSAEDAQAGDGRHRLDQQRTVQVITGTTVLVSLVALTLVLVAPGPGTR